MTEGKPIAKPMIDDAKPAKWRSCSPGEVYLPERGRFFDLQAAQP